MIHTQRFCALIFLSTLSLRRATTLIWDVIAVITISIHALLAESDRPTANNEATNYEFLSTLSLRRATRYKQNCLQCNFNFYPRSPCGERPVKCTLEQKSLNFYPRSPCGERQHLLRTHISPFINFYPRSPCGERPVRQCRYQFANHDFYPRSPCGERHDCVRYCIRAPEISIHALLAESDSKPRRLKSRRCVFLSTLSLRRATRRSSKTARHSRYFYPRSPCGERLCTVVGNRLGKNISIHALLAESDQAKALKVSALCISIHALLAESDLGSRLYDMSAA